MPAMPPRRKRGVHCIRFGPSHERGSARNKRQAHAEKKSATTVVRMNQGFFAGPKPSSTTRKMWARTSRPKITPVLTMYAFMLNAFFSVSSAIDLALAKLAQRGGERPSPTGKVERTRHARIAAQR